MGFLAARIQGLAKPNEVVFPGALFEQEQNKKVISAHTHKLVKSVANLKGLSGEYIVYRAMMK